MDKLTPEELTEKVKQVRGHAFAELTVLERGDHRDAVERWAGQHPLGDGAIVHVSVLIGDTVYEHVVYVSNAVVPHFASFDSQGVLHPTLRLTLSAYYPKFVTYVMGVLSEAYGCQETDVQILSAHVVNK